MKPSQRRRTKKATTPKDIADQFRELQKLRVEVIEAELAAAQRVVDAGKQVEENGHNKPISHSH